MSANKLPWWKTLFNEWGEPEYVKYYEFRTRYVCGTQAGDWTDRRGAIYRQPNLRTGKYKYYVVSEVGNRPLDADAFEKDNQIVFI